MIDARWLFSIIVALVSIIVTYILTRQSKTGDVINANCRKLAEIERDVANLSAYIHKNDLVNRLTKLEQQVHDLDQSVKHNIPELFTKWDQLVCERRRKENGK